MVFLCLNDMLRFFCFKVKSKISNFLKLLLNIFNCCKLKKELNLMVYL